MSFDSPRSGSKSKRSFNSIPSNPSSNSNNGKNDTKKNRTSQKTLGMAWGANSRSSSRSSFRNSPFSDFGSYMVVKNRKLQDQFDAEASNSKTSIISGNPIFQGVSIFVDGFTVPSSQELRGYMLRHGGRFENYFSRHRVTHIVCSNLPDSKIKNLRSFSGGLPVVKPAWVLDSIAANKLLSWVPYQLEQLVSEAYSQTKLSAFFALKSTPVSNDSGAYVTDEASTGTDDLSIEGGTIKDSSLSGLCESVEDSRMCSEKYDDETGESSIGAAIEEPTSNDGKYSERNLHDPCDFPEKDKSNAAIHDQASPCRPSASISSYKGKNSAISMSVGPSNQRHSTLLDPSFVENYFKFSRLHFIGTWRNRYCKRFPSLSSGFKGSSSNTNASGRRNSIIHIDMDCFFVSVVIKNHPELWHKPVAVCHSDNPQGTAEISSANYPARDYGVKAGIFVRDAKRLCPQLVIFPYDFEAYQEVADQFYDILHKHCSKVQAVSCDEAYLDVTDSEVEDPQVLASSIRKEIFETTRCTASAGIAGNLLMARLATRTAKPNGQCYIPPEKVDDYLQELPVKALPGIGHVLEEKLKRRQVETCGQLRMISKESLQKDFGIKTGDMLWNFSRGHDMRLVGVIQESKSVGADVNWGVRFNHLKDCQHFITNLCKEVSLRLQGCGVQGRSFTLKVKKRRQDAKEPVKYLGCGDCENLSHSVTVPMATDDVDLIQRITTQLFGSFHIDVKDIRGMGLQVSKLESVHTAKQRHERNSIRSWLISASSSAKEQLKMSYPAKESSTTDFKKHNSVENRGQSCSESTDCSAHIATNAEAHENKDLSLPPLADLDIGVLESLPPDVISEINGMYDGKLLSFISKEKGKSIDSSNFASEAIVEGRCHLCPCPTHDDEIQMEDKEEKYSDEEILAEPVSDAAASTISSPVPDRIDLMPSSLSQIDISVLQQLPEELRIDILEQIPGHRRSKCVSDADLNPPSMPNKSLCPEYTENRTGPSKELWAGNPPEWVKNFKVSNCWVLKILADTHYKSGSTGRLSSILQCLLSESKLLTDACSDGWDDAISCFCEVLKQYIKLRIESDIEELYVCFCFLRRLTMKSTFFFQVYSATFPYLQAFVGENYGGSLHISNGND